jgi:hypothetical protein
MRKTLVLCLSAAALLAAGCGGGDDEDESAQKEIREVLAQLETLSKEGNGLEICQRLFTPALVRSVKAASDKGNCAAEVNENVATPEAVVDVRSISLADERNAVANVTVQNGVRNAIYLVRTDEDEWRIRSVQPQD